MAEEKKTKKKMGRPATVIDWQLVESLAGIMCTQEEIAAVIGIDLRTLTRNENFRPIYEKGRENGKKSLRRIQWEHAKKSSAMAIWLGKQYLGQRDMIETVEKTENIEIINDVPKSTTGELEVLDADVINSKANCDDVATDNATNIGVIDPSQSNDNGNDNGL